MIHIARPPKIQHPYCNNKVRGILKFSNLPLSSNSTIQWWKIVKTNPGLRILSCSLLYNGLRHHQSFLPLTYKISLGGIYWQSIIWSVHICDFYIWRRLHLIFGTVRHIFENIWIPLGSLDCTSKLAKIFMIVVCITKPSSSRRHDSPSVTIVKPSKWRQLKFIHNMHRKKILALVIQ